MSKLKRSALIHYVDASMNGVSPEWYIIGKDIEDMSVDLGTDVETTTNILDETSAKDNGYQPTISADPYYADPSDVIYEPLVDIAMNRKRGGECATKYLEVIIDDPDATQHKAWIEDCILKPTSYGGGKEGVNIPFTISPNGNRKEGTVKIENKVPVFTAN